MRAILLFSVGFGLTAVTAQAQSQWGLKAGAGVATFHGRPLASEQVHARAAFQGGAFYARSLRKNLSVRAEAQYSIQNVGFTRLEDTRSVRMHYVAVPVLLDVKVGAVHLLAGPQAARLLYSQVSEYSYHVGQYRPMDYALAAGAELELGAHWRLGGRFTRSFRNIDAGRYTTDIVPPTRYNQTLQGYFAY